MTHFHAACRVVRYLKGNPGRGLLFPRHSELQLLGYPDADWAGRVDSQRSTTGYCFFLGNSVISWRAKKQETVSRSSSEAEYRALSTATCELQWLLFLLKDLAITCTRSPVLYCDNNSAIHLASNPVLHERTKHLEIDSHFVRDKVQSGVLRLLPISSKEQLADFFTKALPPPKFTPFISKPGMLDLYHAPACRGVVVVINNMMHHAVTHMDKATHKDKRDNEKGNAKANANCQLSCHTPQHCSHSPSIKGIFPSFAPSSITT